MEHHIAGTGHHKHKLIFIVEDNEMYSFMLDYMLSNEHRLRCMRFSKGEECIDNLALDPDMIILDYVLPGINGLETLKKIKMVKPAVPVIVLTGHYDDESAKEFLKEGVYDYLLKEENNSVTRVKTVVEEVIEKSILENEEQEERIASKKFRKAILSILGILAIVAGIVWYIIR
jgi:DNA-binding NtrC family response regulator